MSDADRLELIRTKILSGPTDLEWTTEEVRCLLERIEQLEKKNAVLSRHALELAQEMENIRGDFGGTR